MIIKPKRKNRKLLLTSYDRNWLFRLYRLLEWHQTGQIRLDASPNKLLYRGERIKRVSIYSPGMKWQRAIRRWKNWHRTGQMRLYGSPEKVQHCIRHLKTINFSSCRVEQKTTAGHYEFQVSVSQKSKSSGQGTITGSIRSVAKDNTIVLRAYPAIGNVVAFVFVTVLCVYFICLGMLYAKPESKLMLLSMCYMIMVGWRHMTQERNIALDVIPKSIHMIPKPISVHAPFQRKRRSRRPETKILSQSTWLSATSSSTDSYISIERETHDLKTQK